jgi:hypothetical protein
MLYFYPEIKAAIIIQEEIVMPERIFLPVIVILFIRAAISPDKANNIVIIHRIQPAPPAAPSYTCKKYLEPDQ